MIRETPRNEYAKAQEQDQGIRVGSGWCSSLRVQGCGWVTMISHGVEISITGGVKKMIRDPTPKPFFFFLFFFLLTIFIVDARRARR